ncbi:MAG: TlpA disulfide reductase family protein [Gammaproteobacteria bacterium]|nr:TlpA disulfide reductase family protein [Gammaproteobacteria bacterium]
MNSRRRVLFVGLQVVIVLCTTAYASYQMQGQSSGESIIAVEPIIELQAEKVQLPVFQTVPKLTLNDLQGESRNLQQWQGQVVVLNFWASWCRPCQSNVQQLVRLQQQYAEQGLQVVGLGVGNQRDLKQAKRLLAMNYPVLVMNPAESHRLLLEWGNGDNIVPYTVIIDRQGRFRYQQSGVMDLAAFDRQLQLLL